MNRVVKKNFYIFIVVSQLVSCSIEKNDQNCSTFYRTKKYIETNNLVTKYMKDSLVENKGYVQITIDKNVIDPQFLSFDAQYYKDIHNTLEECEVDFEKIINSDDYKYLDKLTKEYFEKYPLVIRHHECEADNCFLDTTSDFRIFFSKYFQKTLFAVLAKKENFKVKNRAIIFEGDCVEFLFFYNDKDEIINSLSRIVFNKPSVVQDD